MDGFVSLPLFQYGVSLFFCLCVSIQLHRLHNEEKEVRELILLTRELQRRTGSKETQVDINKYQQQLLNVVSNGVIDDT